MLITTTEELRQFVNVNITLNFADVEPHLRRVEIDIMRKAISLSQMNRFEEYLQSSGSGSSSSSDSTFSEILTLVRTAEANLAMMLWSQTGSVQISSSGIQRFEANPEKGGKKSAFQYQEVSVQETFKNAGYNYLDLALREMDLNLPLFPEFAASTEFQQYRSTIIYNVSKFDESYLIGSYLLFARMKPLMNAVLDFKITPTIGQTLSNLLKAEVLKTSELDTKLQALLPYVRNAIAHFTIVEVLRQPGEMSDKGLIFDGIEAVNANMRKRAQVSDAQIGMRIAQAKEFALNYLEQMKGFLAANITDYPDYATHIGTDDNELNFQSTEGNNFYC